MGIPSTCTHNQWGNAGFPWGGGAKSPGGCKHTILPNFPKKTAWNRKNLGAQGGTHPSCPPRSATVGGKWKPWFCSVFGHFALGCIFGELEAFIHFFIMADATFPFPSKLKKLETQTLGGSVIRSFALECIFGELEPIILFPSTLSKPWCPVCT